MSLYKVRIETFYRILVILSRMIYQKGEIFLEGFDDAELRSLIKV